VLQQRSNNQEDNLARYDDDYSARRSRRNRDEHDEGQDRSRDMSGGRSGYGYGRAGGGYSQAGGRDDDHNDQRGEQYDDGRQSGEYDDYHQYSGSESREHASRGFGRGGMSGGRFGDEQHYSGAGRHARSGYGGEAGTGQRGYDQGMSARYGSGGMGSEYQRHVAGMPSGVGGGMAGKGPKGYKRSDDRIKEFVCDCLTDDPHLDASSLEVQVKDGEVTLTGNVDSREARRHAEDLIEHMSGVKHVQNNLRVQEASQASKAGGTTARS